MDITQAKTQNEKGISVTDIVMKCLRHWVWFVISVVVCLGAGLLFLLSQDVKYCVSLCTMLNEEKSSSASDEQLEALGIHAPVNNLENEMVILRSPDLLAQVTEALHLEVSYYVKSLLGRRTYLYDRSPYEVTFTQDGDLKFRKMVMTIRNSNSVYVVDGTCSTASSITSFQKELRSLPATFPLPDNMGMLTVEPTGVEPLAICFVDIDPVRTAATRLASGLTIKPVSDQASVLQIDLQINNPDQGGVILEELVRQYNESAGKEKKQMALNTATFVNDRLKEISIELGLVEDEVVEYKQKNNIADLNSETELYMQQTGEYERQRIDSETQLRIINMVDRFVRENNGGPIPSVGVTDPELSQVISEYNNNVMLYEQLRKSTSENSPSRQRLEKNLATAQTRIMSLINNERESIRIALANINNQSSSLYSRIQSLPQQGRELLEKERQQKVIENLFLYLMQKREETNVAMASNTEKAKIVISPTDGQKVYPSNKNTLAVFMFFGLAFPVAFIFLSDFFRTTVGSVSELKGMINTKIIGEIPYENSPIVVKKETTSLTAEAFRMLRNNIDYSFGHDTHKLVMVTSAMRGEGKTFVSLNLAIAFSLLNKRVLLVDVDMRKPNINKYLHSKSKEGLTEFLTKSLVRWEKLIEYMHDYPLLHILKAGAIPPNPNELLMSENFRNFIGEVKGLYDYVILDSSPVGLVPDAFSVAEHVDMTLCVVRENYTPKALLTPILNEEQYIQLNNMHIVYNGVSVKK